MTETQAKSSASAGHTGGPVEGSAVSAGTGGRAAIGRASVPGDVAPPTPKFTRPPGMNPPPDSLPAEKDVGGGKKPSAPLKKLGKKPLAGPTPAKMPTASGSTGQADSSSSTGGNGSMGSTAKGQVAEAVRAAKATVSAAAARGPRRARLHLKRVDPWSMMKFSFAVSVVLLIVLVVATSVLYLALDAMGVFDAVNKQLASLIGSTGDTKGTSFKITALGVIGMSAVLGVVNMVMFTALATLGSFIYNVCADLVGGVELTLSEKD
ncbi:MAG: DUF3566 domain-containing protein [Longispora sp.]|nr:DUF3566 domain-containing protein [Longispora sp. (in: high G+C Gram-positive bacteria)]